MERAVVPVSSPEELEIAVSAFLSGYESAGPDDYRVHSRSRRCYPLSREDVLWKTNEEEVLAQGNREAIYSFSEKDSFSERPEVSGDEESFLLISGLTSSSVVRMKQRIAQLHVTGTRTRARSIVSRNRDFKGM